MLVYILFNSFQDRKSRCDDTLKRRRVLSFLQTPKGSEDWRLNGQLILLLTTVLCVLPHEYVHAMVGGGEWGEDKLLGIHAEPSLASTHTLDAGILGFIFASSARVTPLAGLQFPIRLMCTLFFAHLCAQ